MKADIGTMSPITRNLDAILKAADFTLLEAGRTTGSRDQAVNNLVYMNGAGERIYIHTHEPPETEHEEIENEDTDELEPLRLFDMDHKVLPGLFREFDEELERQGLPPIR